MTFARALVLVSLLLSIGLTSRAGAQCAPACSSTETCATDPSSGDTRCVPARGQCLEHPERCFGTGDTPLMRFANGDCDGDLVRNAMEDTATLCDGATVITFEGGFHAIDGSRLDDPGGTQISPNAYTIVLDAFAVGCSEARACPPVDAMDVRCVYLPVVPAVSPPVGACLYYYPLADDTSCLETGATPGAACFDYVDFTNPYDAWAHGDCDGDGIINKQDGPVCRANEVIGAGSGGTLFCVPASFDTASCDENGLTTREVASNGAGGGLAACVDPDAPPVAAFAVCCRSAADCPALEGAHGRCVGLQVFGGAAGACTYDGAPMADDASCLDEPSPAALCLLGDTPENGTWQESDCDGCDGVNRLDPAVCDCAPDAGVNEAGVPIDEAGLPDLDAGGLDSAINTPLDAGPAIPPGSFSGSGCRCVVGTRSPLGLGWAGLLGLLGLLGHRRANSRERG